MRTNSDKALRKILGDEAFLKYLEQNLPISIERLAKSGKLRNFDVSQIRKILEKIGPEGLETTVRVLDAVTINTLEDDGMLVDATISYKDQTLLHNLIKVFSAKEDVRVAVGAQSLVDRLTQNSTLRGKVPRTLLVDHKGRKQVMEYVDGRLLGDDLDEGSKVAKLERVVDDYFELMNYINSRINRDEIIANTKSMRDFNEVFASKYANGNERLLALFRRDIGDKLNARAGKVNSLVHGDLHPRNVMVTPTGVVYLDWANAMHNGFHEYDLGLLLSKVALTDEEEDRVVNYSARLFEPDSFPDTTHESVEAYHRNRVAQDLISSKRYLKRASESSNSKKELMQNCALLLFNQAVRRMRRRKDLFSSELLEEVLKNVAEGVYEVEDLRFRELSTQYHSALQISRDNLVFTAEGEESNLESKEKNIYRIKRSLKRRRLVSIGKRVLPWAASVLFALGGAGIVGKVVSDRISGEQRAKSDRTYTLDSYRFEFRQAYENYVNDVLDGKSRKINSEDMDSIWAFAKEKEISSTIIGNIKEINKHYAGLESAGVNRRFKGVEILDPFRRYTEYYSGGLYIDRRWPEDPVQNFREGIERLARLREECGGDMLKALTKFFNPKREYVTFGWSDEEAEKEALKLAYNAIEGYNMFDGPKFISLKEVPLTPILVENNVPFAGGTKIYSFRRSNKYDNESTSISVSGEPVLTCHNSNVVWKFNRVEGISPMNRETPCVYDPDNGEVREIGPTIKDSQEYRVKEEWHGNSATDVKQSNSD